jgi:hypothetical protein
MFCLNWAFQRECRIAATFWEKGKRNQVSVKKIKQNNVMEATYCNAHLRVSLREMQQQI